MGRRVLSAACLLVALSAGCGSDAEGEDSPSSASDSPPAETSSSAETSEASGPADRAAAILERRYADVVATAGRTPEERRQIRREVASYTTLEADCSPTNRDGVFNCSVSYAPRGYAPSLEQFRMTFTSAGGLSIVGQ